MRLLRVFVLFLVLVIPFVMVKGVWGLPFDVEPPKCHFCCDVDFDGVVDLQDIFLVVASYGFFRGASRWSCAADVNRDGVVNILDVVLVIRCIFSIRVLAR